MLFGSVALVKTGTGLLNLNTLDTGYKGNFIVNAGTLSANSQNGGLGQNVGTRTVTVNAGGTVLTTTNNVFGGGGLSAANLPTLVINSGGLVNSTRYNAIGNVILNGGTLNQNATDGTGTASYQGYDLIGTITVAGTAPSYITNANGNGAHDHLLGGGNTFNVGVTGSGGPDLTVSAGLMNGSGDYGGTL